MFQQALKCKHNRVQTLIVFAVMAGMVACPAPPCLAAPTPASQPAVILNDAVAGKELASELSNLQPTEKVELRGTIKIKKPGRDTDRIPFGFQVLPGESTWYAVYEVGSTNGANAAQSYVIVHQTGKPNEYRRYEGRVTDLACPLSQTATTPGESFTVTDFRFGDLGLEFLHWPHQVLVKREMKRGRICRVLESKPAQADQAAGYSKVMSWIDTETGGLLQADAYDLQGKVLKEFRLNSFKKVEGKWQLQEMEIQNLQTKSRTWLMFDLDDKANTPPKTNAPPQ
jgi:hypothetical protein